MKVNILYICISIIYLLAPINSSYADVADFFKGIGEKAKEQVTPGNSSQNQQKQGEKNKVNTSLTKREDATNSQNNLDVHEYEGALSADDKICKIIVEPFTLTENAADLIDDVAQYSGNKLLEGMFGKRKKLLSSDDVFKHAKSKAKKLNWLPMSQEIAYGEYLHNERLKTDQNIIPRTNKRRVKRLYTQSDMLLQNVLSVIKETYPYKFKIYLINDNDINAEAIPGGYLYLNTGVLKSEYAELVVAHEIAHVLKRHQTRETQAQLIDTVDTLQDLKDLLDSSEPEPATIAKRATQLHGLILKFSRQQELQADACSARIVQRIPGMRLDKKIDPYIAMLSSGIQTDSKIRGKKMRHPSYPERSNRMKEVALDVMTKK